MFGRRLVFQHKTLWERRCGDPTCPRRGHHSQQRTSGQNLLL